ncbi:MAG: hypothetical protein KatS3mg002_0282 [Candidatus Woesearchaeota archaeon]|nr:MAG: hypothetical protein KatS3mg002_0282 [Candidatus Woesearchaeota archaeon]
MEEKPLVFQAYDVCSRCKDKKESKEDRPKGFVEVYEYDENGNKKLIAKSNLVVYQAREYVASRIFNRRNIVPQIPHTTDEFIYWFGIGSGGTPVGDPLNPLPPTLTDTNLVSEKKFLGGATGDGNLGDYRTSSAPDGEGFYKLKLDTVEFVPDTENDSRYLIAKVTINIDISYADGISFSEAGLFTSPPDPADSTKGNPNGPFHLFARLTFPTVVKASRQIVFVWYLYF